MKYSELNPYIKPVVLCAGVKWEFIIDYYDLPLSGIVSFCGIKYYTEIINEEDLCYAMIELTKEQMEEQEYWEKEFIKHVKTEGGNASLFYEPYQNFTPHHGYKDNEVYGYFLLEDSKECAL